MKGTVKLYELPGTKGNKGLIDATQVHSTITAGGFLRALTIATPTTTASDCGSITVWFDQTAKIWRGERHVQFGRADSIEADSKRGLCEWVASTLKLNRGEEGA